METPQLSFQSFQKKLDEAFPDLDAPSSKAARYGMYAGLTGLAIASLAYFEVFPPVVRGLIVLSGLFIEIVGVTVFVGLGAKRTLKDFSFDDRAYAEIVEKEFSGYQQIVAWLRSFPAAELQTRLIFSSARVEGWQRGTLLVIGSIEKLGILPVVIALYFQFKDVGLSWPPDLNAIGTLLALLIFLLYALGMWAQTRKLQILRFERHLKLALDPDFHVVEAKRAHPSVEQEQDSG